MTRIPGIMKGLTYLRILEGILGSYFNLEGQLYGAGIANCKSKFSMER